jgi:hypothetical protein
MTRRYWDCPDHRIGMVRPNKGSTKPPKAPLLTRRTRALAENERLLRQAERERNQEQVSERRARVEAEIKLMLAEREKSPK